MKGPVLKSKKFLAMSLSLLIAVSLLPVGVSASEGPDDSAGQDVPVMQDTSGDESVLSAAGEEPPAAGEGTAGTDGPAEADGPDVPEDADVLTRSAGYTVLFDPNGGGGEMDPAVPGEDGQLTLPACAFTPPDPERQVFQGWNDKPERPGSWYDPGDTVGITSDITFYARWGAPTVSLCSYDRTTETNARGGTFTSLFENDDPDYGFKKFTVSLRDSCSVTAVPDTGYRFAGWYNGKYVRRDETGNPIDDAVPYLDDGNLLTTDAVYEFTVTGNLVLCPVFEKDSVISLSSAVLGGISEKTYTGSAVTQAPVVTLAVYDETRTLTEGVDYTLSYKNNTKAGTATVVVTGMGGYKDTAEKTFRIAPAPIKNASIGGIVDKRYTGKAQTQSPVVSFNGKVLKNGTDYTLSYKNNTKAGKATVTITGKGNFKDDVQKTFQIGNAVVWERLAGASGTGALGTQAKITGKFARSDVAVIATNADFKDALAAVALAGACGAPVLTNPKASLSPLVKDELTRLGVTKVYILGGTSDLSAKVENQIKALPKIGASGVIRISASGASAKAVAASKEAAKSVKSKTVIIATPKSFKDALSISPYAYAAKSPIIYVESNLSLSSASLNYIRSGGFTQAVIVGGPKAIPDAVKTQLTKNTGVSAVNRLGGAGCYNTSRIIAEWEMGKLPNGTGPKTGSLYKYVQVQFQPAVKLGINSAGISRGDGWKDAIAGSALCGTNRAVILLADGTNNANTAVVKAYKKNVARGYVFGGTQAVPLKVMKEFAAASV